MALAIAGCSANKRSEISYGVTTSAQLKAERGEPLSEQLTDATHTEQVLVYADNEKYQIDKDVVVASFRNPSAEESSLLYWRHKFKDKETTFTPVKTTSHTHLEPEMELKCAAEGITVVFDPNQDVVTRVVEHAKQNP